MGWEKKPTGKGHINPYYYECKKEDVTLELGLPYKSDPWMVRLYIGPQTIIKESFRLRGKGRDGEPESLDDLEKAQDKAFRIAINIMRTKEEYYRTIAEKLESMKWGNP